MLRVEYTQVTNLFRLATSIFILREQLGRHQVLVHLQTYHKFFAIHVVHACAMAHSSTLKV